MVIKVNLENFREQNNLEKSEDISTQNNNKISQYNNNRILKKNLSKNSLFLFTYDSGFRLKIVEIVTSKRFRLLINIINLISSIFLILETNEVLNSLTYIVSKICISIYFIEFLLKVIAFGFVLGENTYLKDPCNVLDLFVCFTGIFSLLPAISDSLSIIRVFRVIRPMKILFILPNMKSFIYSLL